jgi:hypothetical protein
MRCQSDRELQERGPQLHARVVDQDVERTDPLLDVRDAGAHRRAVGDVERGRVHVCRVHVRGQLGGGLGEAVAVPSVEDDRAAGLHQPAGQRESDAPAGAGDQGGTAADVEQRVTHRRTPR